MSPENTTSKSANNTPDCYAISPIYDINKTYKDNLDNGPFFESEKNLPQRPSLPSENSWVDFLGFKVASKIGVPAGPLLCEKWTTLAAKLGFDIVTYKTIRSQPHPSHPLPNMLYVDIVDETEGKKRAIKRSCPQDDIKDLGVTNSFGMPSMTKEFLKEDIKKAKESLSKGQVLVVSVVGTPRDGIDLYDDYVEAALFAKDAGAEIIEANYSCPNVSSKEGSIFTNPESVALLSKKLSSALKDTPLIIKIGYIEDKNLLKDILIAAYENNVKAVSAINTVSMRVYDENQNYALGDKRPTSGVCGGPIRPYALEFIKNAREIIDTYNLDLTLIGVGGITTIEHFDEFENAGADFMQVATGMMWDPLLAHKYHQSKTTTEALHHETV